MSYPVEPIAILHSPLREKFGIPRQPGLVAGLRSELELLPPYNDPDAVEGLADYSHLWLTFIFHANRDQAWRPKVRPPRLGGNRSVGVFATRSPYRPNALGLSVVELLEIDTRNGVRLILGGADLLDATPVVDIKPYVAYADALPEARSGFAPEPPQATLAVRFAPAAEAVLAQRAGAQPELRRVIVQLIGLDPRPAYRRDEEPGREYALHLYDFDLRWRVAGGVAEVLSLGRYTGDPLPTE